MAEQKNKQDDTPQTPAVKTSFKGTPVHNLTAINSATGRYMPSFQLEGDIMPDIGAEITVSYGKQKLTGTVDRILGGNNTVALNAK